MQEHKKVLTSPLRMTHGKGVVQAGIAITCLGKRRGV